MDFGSEWGWVAAAYGVTYVSLVAFAGSIAIRIKKARLRLNERS
jgi:hypothetical protein